MAAHAAAARTAGAAVVGHVVDRRGAMGEDGVLDASLRDDVAVTQQRHRPLG